MRRNLITCILSYIVVIGVVIIDIFIGVPLLYIPVAIAVFFFAGRLFLLPTGDNKVDLAVYYPAIFVFIAVMIYSIISPEPNKNRDYYVISVVAAALAAVAPSFLIWLGMISNKKKFFKRKEYEESDEWNPNKW